MKLYLAADHAAHVVLYWHTLGYATGVDFRGMRRGELYIIASGTNVGKSLWRVA